MSSIIWLVQKFCILFTLLTCSAPHIFGMWICSGTQKHLQGSNLPCSYCTVQRCCFGIFIYIKAKFLQEKLKHRGLSCLSCHVLYSANKSVGKCHFRANAQIKFCITVLNEFFFTQIPHCCGGTDQLQLQQEL